MSQIRPVTHVIHIPHTALFTVGGVSFFLGLESQLWRRNRELTITMSCSRSAAPRGFGKVQEQPEQANRSSVDVCSQIRVRSPSGMPGVYSIRDYICVSYRTVSFLPGRGSVGSFLYLRKGGTASDV
jgi:hypothetical protein